MFGQPACAAAPLPLRGACGGPGRRLQRRVRAAVWQSRKARGQPAGREIVTDVVLPAEIFGEAAILDGGRQMASIRCSHSSKVLCVDARVLPQLLPHDNVLTLKLLRHLCTQVRRSRVLSGGFSGFGSSSAKPAPKVCPLDYEPRSYRRACGEAAAYPLQRCETGSCTTDCRDR